MACLALRCVAEQPGDLGIAFDVGLPREIQIAAVGRGLAGERPLQVLDASGCPFNVAMPVILDSRRRRSAARCCIKVRDEAVQPLVARRQARGRLPVEVFVELQQVAPVRILLKLVRSPVHGPPTAIAKKERVSRRWISTLTSQRSIRCPEPVGHSTRKSSPRKSWNFWSDSMTRKLTGNQTGPRQFELPPKRPDRDSAGLVVDALLDAARAGRTNGWSRCTRDSDRMPYGDRNSSSSSITCSTRRSRSRLTSDRNRRMLVRRRAGLDGSRPARAGCR